METFYVANYGAYSFYCIVSTLPIRNGNFVGSGSRPGLVGVSTLPIRNGNYTDIRILIPWFIKQVSTLPIRNGNFATASSV